MAVLLENLPGNIGVLARNTEDVSKREDNHPDELIEIHVLAVGAIDAEEPITPDLRRVEPQLLDEMPLRVAVHLETGRELVVGEDLERDGSVAAFGHEHQSTAPLSVTA